MATVPRVNLKIPQGTTYTHDFNYVEEDGTVINLAGFSARLQFREEKGTSTFFHEATTANTGLIIDAALGRITLIISDSASSAFTSYSGVYDLELISAGAVVNRIVEGKVTVSQEVTR